MGEVMEVQVRQGERIVGTGIVLAYCILAFANDRIEIDGEHIRWRDKLGRQRVDC
ncbi:MAG: hypothetical protein P4L46_05860 [Fimbriimonas sp.]|nr:hypothetical protein [Fimbriimonas sp.]